MKKVISKDGTSIAYDKIGKGPAVIMVSGAFSYRKFPGSVQLAELLSSDFTVYNYDRRGRGDSGDTKPYAIEREIEDLDALIQEAGGSAYVWGLSSGAVLALQAAAHGLNITKLALHEPPFIVDPEESRSVDFADNVTKLVDSEKLDEAIKYFMIQGMGAPAFVIVLLRIMPGVWSRLKAVAHTLPYDAKLLEGYNLGKPLDAKQWASVTMPTLVMEGPESPSYLRHGTQAVAKILPNAQLITKKGLGHTKALSTKIIAPVLKEFFM